MRPGAGRSDARPFVVIVAGIPHIEEKMKYLLLLYGGPAADEALGPEGRATMVEQHLRYGELLRERGAMVLGEALLGPESATTLRFDGDGPPIMTDGPFLEAKEALGGLYVLSCGSADEAIELARQVPRSPGLVAELRPIADT